MHHALNTWAGPTLYPSKFRLELNITNHKKATSEPHVYGRDHNRIIPFIFFKWFSSSEVMLWFTRLLLLLLLLLLLFSLFQSFVSTNIWCLLTTHLALCCKLTAHIIRWSNHSLIPLICVYEGMYLHLLGHMCGGQRSTSGVITLYLTFETRLFIQHWVTNLSRLSDHWAPGICLSFSSQHWAYRCKLPCSTFMWVLGTWTQVLIFIWVNPLSHLPNPKTYIKIDTHLTSASKV